MTAIILKCSVNVRLPFMPRFNSGMHHDHGGVDK